MRVLERSALWPFVWLNVLINDLGKGGGGETMFAGYARLWNELF